MFQNHRNAYCNGTTLERQEWKIMAYNKKALVCLGGGKGYRLCFEEKLGILENTNASKLLCWEQSSFHSDDT